MTWRDGVHLTGTPLWCDARRRRDVCFLSSADRVGRAGHGQLIATAMTLALLDATGGGHLAVPVRQRFTLGTVRLELIPSGRGFGAAALHADVAGRTVLYAGAVRTTAGGVGDAAELRACDAVVVAAPYGEPRHRFPPLAAQIAAAIEWTRVQLSAGRRPVLLVDTLLDGLEVASRLAAEDVPVAGPRALREAAQRIADLVPPPQWIDGALAIGRTGGPALASLSPAFNPRPAREPRASREPVAIAEIDPPPDLAVGSQTFRRPSFAEAVSGVPVIAAPGREPRAIIWLDADRTGLARSLGDRRQAPGGDTESTTAAAGKPPRGSDRRGQTAGDTDAPISAKTQRATDRPIATALVSARALDGAAGYDAGFTWASAADRAQLLAWIEATGARDVFVTGACAESIVAALGARARVIGPPHQMPLFPHEAMP